jgi:hypothetical protein
MMILTVERIELEIFTFTPDDGTPEINLNATALREYLERTAGNDELLKFTITPEMYAACAKEHEPWKLERLAMDDGSNIAKPIIILRFPDDKHVVADGNHRVMIVRDLFAAFMPNKTPELLGWRVEKEVWEKFLV